VSFSCWRSSDQSEQDAHESALDAAKRVLRSMLSGNRPDRYAYGEGPLREEVLERFTSPQGELVAVTTRNASGSLVLNAEQVMFIDVDFSPPSFAESVRYFLAKIFGRPGSSPEARQESEGKGRLERFLGDHPHWGLRLYRTCAGLRALVTHDLFDPAAEATVAALESVGSDPLYVRLCKNQRCFRARLSPKPWRCGHRNNPVRWPMENTDQQTLFAEWESDYSAKQSRYATCRFLGTMGKSAVHPTIAPIIDVHDKATRCHERLELA